MQAPAPSGPINMDVISDIAMQKGKAEAIEPARDDRIFPRCSVESKDGRIETRPDRDGKQTIAATS